MRVGQPRELSWDALREYGEKVRARGFIRENCPWDRMFLEAAAPSYRTMMVEFLSTFLFRPRPAGQPNLDMDDPNLEPPPPGVSFCLFGQRHNMSLCQFAVATGFYTEDKLVQDIYTTAITAMPDDQLLASWPTLCREPFGKKARVSLIPDPLIRYLPRRIATSISSRCKRNGWITKKACYIFTVYSTGPSCSLHHCLAQYSKRQTRSRLYGRAFITCIAHHCSRYFPFIGELP
ncbi:hypothetical protein HanPI659440_Chr11g0434521 [Helianthus annuus]|nr:hypothetical protein HanPI659440_Chr11g0434521 [Helianthus annuus]